MSYIPGQNLVTTNPEQWQDRLTAVQTALNLDEVQDQLNVYTAVGAIVPYGTAILVAGSAAAMTLAAPVAGAKPAGQDGNILTIVAADAFAYTVTTPANGYKGSLHIATWSAAIGNNIDLVAYNGTWYPVGTPLAVAFS